MCFILIVFTLLLLTVALGQNPFERKHLYVNKRFQRQVSHHIHRAKPEAQQIFDGLMNVSTAFWISQKKLIRSEDSQSQKTFLGVLADAASQNPAPLVTAVIYDLPNRDCAAHASNGEICCVRAPDGTCDYTATGCDAGILEYRKSYIDVIANVSKQFCHKVPLVFIIEPDSLPNLATNMENPNCGSNSTQSAYRTGIAYAIRTLAAACPAATMYLDAAHGGWLGWQLNAEKFVNDVRDLGVAPLLKGFALNVANYQDLGVWCPSVDHYVGGKNEQDACCQQDPCGLIQEWNSGHTELNYVDVLTSKVARAMPGFSPTFVIDTARNGVPNARQDCSNWCNIRGAGFGLKPSTATSHELVDAYLWIKPPRESDGCTETLPDGDSCHRFDLKCASVDRIGSLTEEPRSPEAGKHFKYFFAKLVLNSLK